MGRMPNHRYRHAGARREIDLIATFESHEIGKDGNFSLFTSLVIECKKAAEKPWVFFSTPTYTWWKPTYYTVADADTDPLAKKANEGPTFRNLVRDMEYPGYSDDSIPRCISYVEAFRKPHADSEIYDAIDSALSCVHVLRESRKGRKLGGVCDVFLPIIVLEGRLFEAQTDGGHVEIVERQHVQLRTVHDQQLYSIDVITKNQFSVFLDAIEKMHQQVAHALEAMPASTSILALLKEQQTES